MKKLLLSPYLTLALGAAGVVAACSSDNTEQEDPSGIQSDGGAGGAKEDDDAGSTGGTTEDDKKPGATCDDGKKNQNETDVDCGGKCDACNVGDSCDLNSDCESGSCSGDWMGQGGAGGQGGAASLADGSICLEPSCTDGVANGDETDVDCGNSCSACEDLAACDSSEDCLSGVCGDMDSCVPPLCGDAVTNGVEECDSAGVDSALCDHDCSLQVCGDGYTNEEASETCDDGNNDLEICTYGETECTVCNETCAAVAGETSFCGDSVVDEENGEDCDDGLAGSASCSTSCEWILDAQCALSYAEFDDVSRVVDQTLGSSDARTDNVSHWSPSPDWAGADWYRFAVGDGKMPESAPEIYSCGTHAPGWLDGAHPSVNEGVVSASVCFNWNGDPCEWSASIEIVNCGDFYLYNLPQPPINRLRYCADVAE